MARQSAATASLALALALVWSRPARADGPHLRPTGFAPEGFTWGLAVLGGSFRSSDCCDIGGRRGGGAVSLRWGVVAGEGLIWLVQLDSGQVLAEDARGELRLNQTGATSLAAQYYLRHALWIKGGLGLAAYTIRAEGGEGAADDRTRDGIAALASAGYDLVRSTDVWFFGAPRQDFALGAEILIVGSAYPRRTDPLEPAVERDRGWIGQFTLGFSAQWY
jgi:hypothetical protein